MKTKILDFQQIEIEKKKIKNMYLRVLPPDGRIHITAPLRVKDEDIDRFIIAKQEWIQKQRETLLHKKPLQELAYVTGEMVPVWGELRTLVVYHTMNRNMVIADGDSIILKVKKDSTDKQREQLLNKWYLKELQQVLPSMIHQWESVIGVTSSSWKIRDMKTRWGSCNIRSKRVCFNLQLAKKAPKCLEYVVVHELVHLLEKSHNQIFKGYMDKFLPDWRITKKELNT